MLRLKNELDVIRDLLICLMHGFLLLPVLNLLMTINHVPGRLSLFTFFILSHISALLLKKAWLYLLVQSAMSFLLLYWLFPHSSGSLGFRAWVQDAWSIGLSQWRDLMASNLTEVPYLLLFTGLLLLITVLTFLLLHLKQALPSFFSGLVYIFTLHTFTSRDVLVYLVSLVSFGIVLVAFTQIHTQTSRVFFVSSALLTTLFTLLLVSFSYLILGPLRPTQEWVETKSNAYQKDLDDRGMFDWINDNAVGIGFRRTGMGTDDTELGGRLHQDFSPVFKAHTTRPHYWKVLHRTEYTGLGWKSDYNEYFNEVSSPLNNRITEEDRDSGQREEMLAEETVSTIRLEWYEELTYLAYPYGWFDIELEESGTDYIMALNSQSAYISIQNSSEPLSEYMLAYDRTLPDRFDEDALQADDGWREEAVRAYKEMNPDNASAEIDSQSLFDLWFEDELQLPSSLPQRVTDLAAEITDGLETEYAMIRAIETYLKQDGGYRYSLIDVENTPENGDYVDHFLFESKVGYCDNFSTAMTVMLRSLGIPVRWAKGFNFGSHYINEQNEEYYIVDNSNAHSWPEVYFPSYGWIPFEPSPSFSNPISDPEAAATVRGETYSFEEEITLDLENPELESDLQDPTTVNGPDDDMPDLDEENLGEDALDATASERLSESEQRQRRTLYTFIAFMTLLLGWFVGFRWHTLLWLIKLLIEKDRLSLSQATRLVLRLYYLKLRPTAGETIQLYFTNWKPYASSHVELIDRFTELADAAFYNKHADRKQLTLAQKKILTGMLDVYTSQPRLHGYSSRSYYRTR